MNDIRNQHGFYSLPEVARMTGLSHGTVRRLASEGKLQATYDGKRWLISTPRERALWRGLDVACVVVALAAAVYFGSGIVGAWFSGALARAVAR